MADPVRPADLQETITRVERSYHNERASAPGNRHVEKWLAGVSYEEWLATVAALDGLAADLAPAEREEMACDRCRRYHGVVWSAPSDVWNKVMRDGDRANADEYSFCCPNCFIQLAEERGINPTGWQVAPEDSRLTAADIALEATREALRQMHFHEAESDAQEFCQKIIALAAGSVAPPDGDAA